MKAIAQDSYGSTSVLALRDIERPTIGDQDVLVRVHAAGCGPDVWHVMTGLPYLARLMVGFRRPKIAVRGSDFAGVVEATGPAVTDLDPGDEVLGIAEGSFAEFARAPRAKVVRKPARLSFEEAAAIPISGLTALQAIRDLGKVQTGQRVLIIGAAGGVGTLAVQIAKVFAAHVTGVCSTSKSDLVRSIGADALIDYTSEDFADGRRHWDVIIDTAGRRSLSHLRRALTPRGTLVIVGGDGGGRWTGGFFRGILRAPLLSIFIKQRLVSFVSKEKREDLEALRELIEAGKIRPVIDRSFPLAEAPDAIRYLEQGHPRGKIVIVI